MSRIELKEDEIIEIKKLFLFDNLSISQIAAKFNVSIELIERINEEK